MGPWAQFQGLKWRSMLDIVLEGVLEVSWSDLGRPLGSQDASKMAQDGATTTPRSFKMAPGRAKMSPRRAKMEPGGAKMEPRLAMMALRWAKMVPRQPKMEPNSSQDDFNTFNKNEPETKPKNKLTNNEKMFPNGAQKHTENSTRFPSDFGGI